MLSYGRFEDLNANFDRNGLITGFTLRNFAASTDALPGFLSLTVYSDAGVGTVTKSIADFAAASTPGWLHAEFNASNPNFSGDVPDFSNVQRLDVNWGGFTNPGADFDFSFFGTINGLPEPGTMSMLLLALGVIMLARKRTRVTPEPVPVRASGPSSMMTSTPSASDLYSLPNRPF